ncbi:hypothetical protein ECANGB1_1339 [Enterospora canceri]|uniref:Uncharacterized protein n=1 Tax=Enterospora canceri TaxID=1081671 RepID=A0A1Y1S660_9MICR|nr:hypothetical protein ECANGB1_1339 [Enterospora canceri]
MNSFYFPIEFVYEDGFRDRDELVERVGEIEQLKIVDELFFSNLILSIQRGEDVKKFVRQFCPKMDSMLCITIEVRMNESETEEEMSIVYNKETLSEQIEMLLYSCRRRWEKTIRSHSGLNSFTSLFKTPYATKCLADAYYYTKNFRMAEQFYRKIVRNYALYTDRMIGLCGHQRGSDTMTIFAADIYMANDEYDKLYDCRKVCGIRELRDAIELHLFRNLEKTQFGTAKQLVILYNLFKNSISINNRDETNKMYNLFVQSINKLKMHKSEEEKRMWNRIIERATAEYKESSIDK